MENALAVMMLKSTRRCIKISITQRKKLIDTGVLDYNRKQIRLGDILTSVYSESPKIELKVVWQESKCRFALVGGNKDLFEELTELKAEKYRITEESKGGNIAIPPKTKVLGILANEL
jgi:hypothetical protein